MQIPKKLEPFGGSSEKLNQAYKKLLFDKFEGMDKIKTGRKRLDTPETRQSRLLEATEQWQTNCLLPYALQFLDEAEQALSQTEKDVADFENTIKDRRLCLALGLGHMLGSDPAGSDLCSILIRMAGGYIDEAERQYRVSAQSRIMGLGIMIQAAKGTIAEIEAVINKPIDRKQITQTAKQTLIETLGESKESEEN